MAWLPGYDQIKAPNHSTRQGSDPLFITIHYSAGILSAGRLGVYFQQNPQRNASYHFGISRGRESIPDRDMYKTEQRQRLVYQYVDTDRAAWSSNDRKNGAWTKEKKRSPNMQGVNICFANAGFAHGKHYKEHRTHAKHEKGGAHLGWEMYRLESVYACIELVLALKKAHPTIEYICGHEDHVFGKVDPGPAFPWGLLCWQTGLPRFTHMWAGRNKPGPWVKSY